MRNPRSTPGRHEMFQTSLMSALLDGVYDGEMTIRDLLGHGDFGLGTFNALDGEMVVLDGVCYQLRGSGKATVAPLDLRTPFAVLTRFVPTITTELAENQTRQEVSDLIHSLIRSENYLYAIRVTGEFEWVRTRTAARQSKPYPPLVAATRGEPVRQFDDVSGVVAGFRTPLYESGIGVPGGHVHFLTADPDRRRSCAGLSDPPRHPGDLPGHRPTPVAPADRGVRRRQPDPRRSDRAGHRDREPPLMTTITAGSRPGSEVTAACNPAAPRSVLSL